MKTLYLALWMTLIPGCSESAESAGRVLTARELSHARSVDPFGDAVIVVGGREYIGGVLLEVDSSANRVVLNPVGRTAEPPIEGAGGEIRIPVELATQLAENGWDFTIQLNTDLVYADPELANFSGPTVGGFTPTELRMRAEPDGLFVATISLGHRDGRTETVEMYGRLTAGCAVRDSDGGLVVAADPTTIPLCAAIMSGL